MLANTSNVENSLPSPQAGSMASNNDLSETRAAVYELYQQIQNANTTLRRCAYADIPETDQVQKIRDFEAIIKEQEYVIFVAILFHSILFFWPKQLFGFFLYSFFIFLYCS